MANAISRALTTPSHPTERDRDDEVRNHDGHFVYGVTPEQRLKRFLVLGTDGGSYYQSERDLTKENLTFVNDLVKSHPGMVVDVLESTHASCPRKDPSLYCLAALLALSHVNVPQALFNEIVGIGTHLFKVAEYVNLLGGWGARKRLAFTNWYAAKQPMDMAYDVIKYRQRDGWTHRDVMRLAHPRHNGAWGKLDIKDAIAKWACDKTFTISDHKGLLTVNGSLPIARIMAHEEAQRSTSAKEVCDLIRRYDLPRESVPTNFLNDPQVWEALLEKMPITAVIRNLGKMTNVGLLSPLSAATAFVVTRLTNIDQLKKKKVHPFSVLLALKTYSSGRGFRGSLSWQPVPEVCRGLERAFALSFASVVPSGKRIYMALDVSPSMWQAVISDSNITAAEAAAAMSLITSATESRTVTKAFSGQRVGFGSASVVTELPIVAGDSLSSILEKTRTFSARWGSTDCALPMIDATRNGIPVDLFVVYTDNETNSGFIKPSDALRRYRQKSGINAKLVVVGMTATGFTIADPRDAGMMDVVGFDSTAPSVISDFAAGRF